MFIGPDKSGSTWLYESFCQHPEIYVAPVKELFFFDRYYEKGIDWYLSFFRKAPVHAKAIGELSHDYLFSSIAAQRIASHFPSIKLIVNSRNPFQRTFSHYLHLVRHGVTREPLIRAIETFPELVNNSLYSRHLPAYFHLFDPSQIGVFMFDDLVNNPVDFGKQLFDFLGVSFCENIDYYKKVLPASKARNFYLARLVTYGSKVFRDLYLVNLVTTAKQSRMAHWFYRPYAQGEKPSLTKDEKKVLREKFEDDILDLQDLLDKDFSSWLNC